MFVPAFATHICLGAPYGWSAISSNLSKELGFVASASADWTLDLCTYPMSIMIAAGKVQCVTIDNRQSPFYVVNRVTLTRKELH